MTTPANKCLALCRQCWAVVPFVDTVKRDAWLGEHTGANPDHEVAGLDGWPPRVPALRVAFPPRLP